VLAGGARRRHRASHQPRSDGSKGPAI
jgi:hypothetical protein